MIMATPLTCNVLSSSVVHSLFSSASLSARSAFNYLCISNSVTLVFIRDRVKVCCRSSETRKAVCRSFVIPVGVQSHLGLLHSWVTQRVFSCCE